MATLNDRVYDLGLNVLDTEANVLHINSLETSTYAQTTSNSLGNKTSLSVGAPADGAVSGRRVTVAAITDGSVTSTERSHFILWLIHRTRACSLPGRSRPRNL